MNGSAVPGKDVSGRTLAVILVTVMVTFVLNTIVHQRRAATIDALSDSIVSSSSPAVEHLAGFRGALHEAKWGLSHLLDQEPVDPASRAEVEAALARLDRAAERYLELPVAANELPYHAQLQLSLTHFVGSADRTLARVDEGPRAAATELFLEEVEPAANEAINAAMQAIEVNARNGRAAVLRMKEVRRLGNRIENVLTGLSVLLGVVGAVVIRGQSQRHRRLVEANSKFHQDRADELEQFAGRVAHDIRNPLAAARLGAELMLRAPPGTSPEKGLARILHCLERAESITAGLLAFARSGAATDPGARTDLRTVIADLAAGAALEAEQARIELRVEPVPPVLVGCSTGVYLSLLGNLVRNAIKYMGDSPVRRVVIRVREEGELVRTEVCDSGPGIAGQYLPSLFEAYFRAGNSKGKDGLGLGLATVKKLAEGHHGSVGVLSRPGEGSNFWFLLPRAGLAFEPAGDASGLGHQRFSPAGSLDNDMSCAHEPS